MNGPSAESVQPAEFVDSDHPAVIEFARRATMSARTDKERASALFAEVRDSLRYDPYGLSPARTAYRASAILTQESAWCVPKAVLLTAAARAVGIPALLGFSDVRNHLTTPKLSEAMGTDLFVYHGWTQMWIEGAWHKASPAFNSDLCRRFGVDPLEFDGRSDALLHAYDGSGHRYMEYVEERGTFADLPFEEVMGALRRTYGDLIGRDTDDTVFKA